MRAATATSLFLVAAWPMLTACPTCTKVGETQALGRSDTAVLIPPRTGWQTAVMVLGAGN
ncbi:MAG: hypothetical protein WD691_06765 [Acidimicrobiales bacterium]